MFIEASLIILFSILCLIIVGYRLSHFTDLAPSLFTVYKTTYDGIEKKLIIEKNYSYVVYNQQQITQSGSLNQEQISAINYLVQNFPQLNQEQCDSFGGDMFKYNVEFGGQFFSFNNLSTKCLPKDISDKLTQLLDIID